MSHPTPERLLNILNAHQQTAALKAGVELELFTAIAEGATDADALAVRCQASPRGMRMLCDFLTISGLLTKSDGLYGLAPDAAVFLDKRSPAYMGTITRFLAAELFISGFQDLANAVRKGGTLMGESGTMAPDHPAWVEFARSMVPLMAPASQEIASVLAGEGISPTRVLDIAASHGMFGIAIAKAFPQAEVTALDWQAVLEVAKENAAKAGVANRYHTITGSVFEVDLGGPYDLALVPNFYHHFDPPTCTELARKIHASLADGGHMATLEFIPNPDRITPPVSAAFSIIMLVSTARGDAYTFAEFDRMFLEAGFTHNEIHQMERSPEQLIVSRR